MPLDNKVKNILMWSVFMLSFVVMLIIMHPSILKR